MKVKQMRFGQSVFNGEKEITSIRPNDPYLETTFDGSKFVIFNKKVKKTILVFPTNVQYAEVEMEAQQSLDDSSEGNKAPSKTRSPRA